MAGIGTETGTMQQGTTSDDPPAVAYLTSEDGHDDWIPSTFGRLINKKSDFRWTVFADEGIELSDSPGISVTSDEVPTENSTT